MKNSDKIRTILDGGNAVKVKAEDYTCVIIGRRYDKLLECDNFIIEDDPEGFAGNVVDICVDISFTPICRKPKWKKGDVVDVCKEFGEYKKGIIDEVKRLGHVMINVKKNVYKRAPFWAIAAHIPEEKPQKELIEKKAIVKGVEVDEKGHIVKNKKIENVRDNHPKILDKLTKIRFRGSTPTEDDVIDYVNVLIDTQGRIIDRLNPLILDWSEKPTKIEKLEQKSEKGSGASLFDVIETLNKLIDVIGRTN